MINYFDLITEKCMEFHRENSDLSPVEMAIRIMAKDDFPMHSPHHHHLVPAVLLTAACIKEKKDAATLQKYLDTAKSRAIKVPPAFCGDCGACGAALGDGIFASIWTGTTPHSKDTLGMINQITAESLMRIAQYSGPRCCKRVTFLALEDGVKLAEKHIGVSLKEKKIICGFFKANDDCIGSECCFYLKN